ncbi:lipase family protein [Nocardia aobensis]|uniref:lipase family protein n=1 Tax=Nocardia aobensis TaxID=257277 RepID=UPI001FDF8104|nr:lipase family protein [Nocardia aobensis]
MRTNFATRVLWSGSQTLAKVASHNPWQGALPAVSSEQRMWLVRGFLAAVVTVVVAGALLGEPPARADEGPPIGPMPPLSPVNLPPSPLQNWIDANIKPPQLTTGPGDQQAALWRAILSSPTGDQTFDAWPANLAGLEPGQIIETRDVTATAAQHMAVPIQRAELLKFRSTSGTGTPSFGTATLITPAASWDGPGSRPVEVNAMPINALGLHCTPGYQLSHDILDRTNSDLVWFLPAIWSALNKGHAVLLPDHEGPLMAYGETNVAGHMMLDSIRAVRNALPEFGNSRYVVDGYSGGAIAAYATAMLQSEYAPELSDVLMGVASGGLAADYRNIAHRFNGWIASGILLSVSTAIAREHPEVLQYMNNLAQWVTTSPTRDLCGDADGPLGVVGIPMDVATNIGNPLDSPVAENLYRQLDLSDRRSGVPLYIYHGAWDPWIPLEDAQRMYGEQCSRGVPAIFRTVPGEHLSSYVTSFPGLEDWIDARLRGEPAPSECPGR